MFPRWITSAIEENIITTIQAQRLLDSLYQPLVEEQELSQEIADISLKLYFFRQQSQTCH